MKKINKLKRYMPFCTAGMKTTLVYKAQTIMWIVISLVEVLFIVFLYHAIYRNAGAGLSTVINGFTFYEMVLYMITSFVFSFVVFSSETSFNIYQDIKEGTIANTLTKPVSYRLRYLFTYMGSFALGFVLIMLPLLSITLIIFGFLGVITFSLTSILNILLFLCFTILACFINDAICFFVGLLTFFTEHMFGLNMFKNAIQNFTSGTMVPLSYMGFVGVIFSFTPFAFLNSTPVLVLMGKIAPLSGLKYIGIAVFWIFLLEFVNHCLFSYCIKKVTVQGG